MGLIGEGNRPITDAQVSLAFFQLAGEQAIKKAESPATFRWIDLETKGLYVANVEFETSGRWGVEVTAARPNSAPETARLPLEIRETGQAPTIGTAAPRSKTPTTNDVKDLSEICSNGPPCELHTVSVDEALSNGKPSVILFASPGFCVTATCAPELSVVLQTRLKQGERANFVHVEIFKDPRNRVVADAVTQWNLPSEPWVFIADRTGAISDRFEGLATADELDQALQAVL